MDASAIYQKDRLWTDGQDMDGIDTVEQMAAHKQKVINAARGTVVLNADDVECVKLIEQYPSHRLVLFSNDASNEFIQDHLGKAARYIC